MSRMVVDGEPDAAAVNLQTSKELCPALYGACLQDPDRLYSQEDLLNLNVIPGRDIELLKECVTNLCGQRRFQILTQGGKVLWKVVKREDAARYKGLNQEEAIVLSYVDNAQREGIWIKHIRYRSHIHQTNVMNALRRLEQRAIVKQVASAKFPKRKVYMLAHLQPSEDVTGGPFFTDGVLDEDYVYHMTQEAYRFVAERSWDERSRPQKPSKLLKIGSIDKEEEMAVKGEMPNMNERYRSDTLPMPPGYGGYPTLAEITEALNNSNISAIRLLEGDVKQLLDLLCWDGRIVKVLGGRAYQSVKGASRAITSPTDTNGFTEGPCGRCPVFDWCENGGPANAQDCVYFANWLEH